MLRCTISRTCNMQPEVDTEPLLQSILKVIHDEDDGAKPVKITANN